jgi:hypothetical protein
MDPKASLKVASCNTLWRSYSCCLTGIADHSLSRTLLNRGCSRGGCATVQTWIAHVLLGIRRHWATLRISHSSPRRWRLSAGHPKNTLSVGLSALADCSLAAPNGELKTETYIETELRLRQRADCRAGSQPYSEWPPPQTTASHTA